MTEFSRGLLVEPLSGGQWQKVAVARADLVVHLQAGQLAAAGTHEQMCVLDDSYAQVCAAQAKSYE